MTDDVEDDFPRPDFSLRSMTDRAKQPLEKCLRSAQEAMEGIRRSGLSEFACIHPLNICLFQCRTAIESFTAWLVKIAPGLDEDRFEFPNDQSTSEDERDREFLDHATVLLGRDTQSGLAKPPLPNSFSADPTSTFLGIPYETLKL